MQQLKKKTIIRRMTNTLSGVNKYSIRYFIINTIILATSLIATSCSDDEGYSLGNFKTNLATVKTIDNEKKSFYLTLDDGSTLLPTNMVDEFIPTDNRRVFLNYTPLSDQTEAFDMKIHINSISYILTKDITYLDNTINEDQMGNDQTEIISVWLGDNFINFRLKIKMGGEPIQHALDLVYDPRINIGNDSVRLQLRHSAYNDPARYEESTYAAFDIKSLIDNAKNDLTFVIETLDFKNTKQEYILQYKKAKTE